MRQDSYKKYFFVFFVLTVLTAMLLICCCIPRSWGFQQVREFFDLVDAVGGSHTGNAGWLSMEALFCFFVFITDQLYGCVTGKKPFFSFSEDMSISGKVVKVLVCAVLAMGIGAAFHYLRYYTFFM